MFSPKKGAVRLLEQQLSLEMGIFTVKRLVRLISGFSLVSKAIEILQVLKNAKHTR